MAEKKEVLECGNVVICYDYYSDLTYYLLHIDLDGDLNGKKKKLTIRWKSNYYCCYYYDYNKKGLFVFLFGPKLETIYGTPFAPTSLTNCLKVIIVWSEQDINRKEQ